MVPQRQHEVYSYLIGLDYTIWQATSDLLAYQRHLYTLPLDLKGAHLTGPVNQDHPLRPQHPSPTQAPLPFPFILVASFVVRRAPSQALPHDFSEGARVIEAQDPALPSLITTPTTSELCPPRMVSTTETAPQFGPYTPGVYPFETMLAPFPTVVNYGHCSLADTTDIPTANDLHTTYPASSPNLRGFTPP